MLRNQGQNIKTLLSFTRKVIAANTWRNREGMEEGGERVDRKGEGVNRRGKKRKG